MISWQRFSIFYIILTVEFFLIPCIFLSKTLPYIHWCYSSIKKTLCQRHFCLTFIYSKISFFSAIIQYAILFRVKYMVLNKVINLLLAFVRGMAQIYSWVHRKTLQPLGSTTKRSVEWIICFFSPLEFESLQTSLHYKRWKIIDVTPFRLWFWPKLKAVRS